MTKIKNQKIQTESGKKKPFLAYMKGFPWSISFVVLWTIVLSLFFVFLCKDTTSWQFGISLGAIVLSWICVSVCFTTKHVDDIKTFKPCLMWLHIILSSSVIFASIVFVLMENSKSIIWVVAIICLCCVNIILTTTKRTGVESVENMIRSIKKIEVLAVVIALLQLIVAIPQLQKAYESASSSDIENLRLEQKRLYQRIQDFVVVDIPDSLQNIEVKRAQIYQMRMFANATVLNNIDTFDVKNSFPNIAEKRKCCKSLISNWCAFIGNECKSAELLQEVIYVYRSPQYKEIEGYLVNTLIVANVNDFAEKVIEKGANDTAFLDSFDLKPGSEVKDIHALIDKYDEEKLDETYARIVRLNNQEIEQINQFNEIAYQVIYFLNFVQLYFAY